MNLATRVVSKLSRIYCAGLMIQAFYVSICLLLAAVFGSVEAGIADTGPDLSEATHRMFEGGLG